MIILPFPLFSSSTNVEGESGAVHCPSFHSTLKTSPKITTSVRLTKSVNLPGSMHSTVSGIHISIILSILISLKLGISDLSITAPTS